MGERKKRTLCGDARADEMASCLIFALRAFRNKPIFDSNTKKMEGWHAWFKRALANAGYQEAEKEV